MVPERTHYAEMLTKQGGVCAICAMPETSINRAGEIKRLSVDHCHETAKVRGLLCMKCNTGLGGMRHDVKVLLEAIRYLRGDIHS